MAAEEVTVTRSTARLADARPPAMPLTMNTAGTARMGTSRTRSRYRPKVQRHVLMQNSWIKPACRNLVLGRNPMRAANSRGAQRGGVVGRNRGQGGGQVWGKWMIPMKQVVRYEDKQTDSSMFEWSQSDCRICCCSIRKCHCRQPCGRQYTVYVCICDYRSVLYHTYMYTLYRLYPAGK